MSLIIDHPDADRLAHELMDHTGETLNQAVVNALRQQLQQERAKKQAAVNLKQQILAIGQECANLPLLDSRPVEEILGYDEIGVPG
jgi:antitoxin VapB